MQSIITDLPEESLYGSEFVDFHMELRRSLIKVKGIHTDNGYDPEGYRMTPTFTIKSVSWLLGGLEVNTTDEEEEKIEEFAKEIF